MMIRISIGRGLALGAAAVGLLLSACEQSAEPREDSAEERKRVLVIAPFSSDRPTSEALAAGTGRAAGEASDEPWNDPPEGVVYFPASNEANNRALERVNRLFSSSATDDDLAEGLGKVLLCGPGLWQPLAERPEFKRIPSIPTQLIVPQFRDGKVVGQSIHAGRVFQTAESVRAFWKALGAHYDPSPVAIRKLNRHDMQLYWAMIPYDIEEPVFIVTTRDNDFLVDFTGEDLHVFAVDDFRPYRVVL
jgi:hypothetical protein